jgi:site-specific recombinase XerD
LEELTMNSSLALAPPAGGSRYACRRVFDNSQLIERFEKWLVALGFSVNTRTSYIFTAREFGKFLVDRPIASVTKDDVRDYIWHLYARNLAAGTLSHRHFALRTFFHFLRLGDQVRISAPHQSRRGSFRNAYPARNRKRR